MTKSALLATGNIIIALCTGMVIALPAQTLTTLANFNGTDGAHPHTGLIQARDGNYYGTTYQGGPTGDGTIFRVDVNGALTVVANFFGSPLEGANPAGVLLQDSDGTFWGTTYQGGPSNPCYNGCGTIFHLTPQGIAFDYNFCSRTNCSDGVNPLGGLVKGKDGSFYGMTSGGGANGIYPFNSYGTVFKFTRTGVLTTLHSFCSQPGCADGEYPFGELVQGTDGNFYGTTEGAGAYGSGTVFKITPEGALTTIHIFQGNGDGYYPTAGLVQGLDGNFYGTTSYGGVNTCGYSGYACGTVFKITPGGAETVLHSFNGIDGGVPEAPLVQGSDGNFYGTTSTGGDFLGTIFRVSAGGELLNLYTFEGYGNGAVPLAGLVQGSDGNFYGTTSQGGSSGAGNDGTVLRLSMGLSLTTVWWEAIDFRLQTQ